MSRGDTVARRPDGNGIDARKFSRAYVEITNVCNLRCDFCPGTTRKKEFMDEEHFEIVAKKLRPVTDTLFLHVMGEPLLSPHLEGILRTAGELGFTVNATTNGTLLAKNGNILLASPSVGKVSISLHSFEANEDGTDFDEYLRSCLEFAKSAADRGIISVLRLWNLDGESTRGKNSLNPRILEVLDRVFAEPARKNYNGYCLSKNVFLEYGEKFEWPEPEPSDGECVGGFCYGLRAQIAVLCDGTVVPCCLDRNGDMALGNIFSDELPDILRGDRARAIYDGFTARRPVENMCKNCGYATRFKK